jgi:molybdopterin converting factor small subunit
MSPAQQPSTASGTQPRLEVTPTVTVRLWAGARAAAGVAELDVDVPAEGTSVAALREQVVRRFADRPRLAEVLAVCSTLVGDQPVGRADPGSVLVAPGQMVEFLPPFAGG